MIVDGTLRPILGTDLYVPTVMYLSHGADDFLGGKCQVARVYDAHGSTMVSFVERPGHSYTLHHLLQQQEKLAAEYGDRRGHPDPDDHPSANTGW